MRELRVGRVKLKRAHTLCEVLWIVQLEFRIPITIGVLR